VSTGLQKKEEGKDNNTIAAFSCVYIYVCKKKVVTHMRKDMCSMNVNIKTSDATLVVLYMDPLCL
jgi:hypothetical protein